MMTLYDLATIISECRRCEEKVVKHCMACVLNGMLGKEIKGGEVSGKVSGNGR